MQVFKRRAAGIAVAVFFLAGWQGQALAQATASAAAGTSHSLDDTYRSHIEFLANPFMEGRGPGTRGNEIASEYIESWYTTIGLKPELPWTGRGSPGHPTNGPREPASGSDPGVQPAADSLERRSFRQEFTAGSRAQLESGWLDDTSLAAKDVVFKLGADYSVLGFSGDAKVELPLAFVGYSIEGGGPDKAYSSYSSAHGETPLAGRIAVMFRFEPMNASGESLWRKKEDTLWTPASAIADKIGAAIKRGAAGILLVNPPGCADARATKLESTEGSARWTQRQDIPIFMTTAPAAERLLKAHDSEGRTILRWRQLADSQGGVVLLDDKPVKMEAKIDRSPRTTWNIAGVLPGRGPLASQYVVIGAHYDHVGYGYTGGSRSDEYGIVHPGADDNASGASGLLLGAEILKKRFDAEDARLGEPGHPRRSIMFIAFSAEEMGLIGSREFMKACPIDAKQIDCMLNMDMIGRLRENKLELSGTGTAEGFMDILRPELDSSGLNIQASPGGRGPSDHATFYGAGIPVLHFFTGYHEQYHTPRDTVDLINIDGSVKVVNLVCDIASTLAHRDPQLAFVSTDRKTGQPEEPGKPQISLGGIKVRFGIAPGNYADGEAGILVGDVFPGTCAAEAGIQKDDRLIRWNGKEIGDVQSWMGMLAQHKPGDVVDVDVRRGKEEIRVRATLKSRDQAPK